MTAPRLFRGLPDVFLGTFGVEVTVAPKGGVPRVATGIFRREAIEVMGQIQRETMLAMREADAADLQEGAAVYVDGTEYSVRYHDPDGRGMTHLYLSKA